VLQYSFFAAAVAAAVGALMIRANVAMLGHQGERMALLDIYKLGPPFLILRVNFWLFNMAGIWILGMFRPLEEVALYGAANIISSLVLAPQTIMNGVGAPVIVELFHKQRLGLLEKIIRTAAFFALMPAVVLSLLLLFAGESVLSLVYSAEYQQAASIMVILAAGRCVAVFCGVPATTLSMTDHQNLVMKAMLLLSLLTVGTCILVAEQSGALGIAVVTAVSIATQNLVLAYLVKKRLDILTFPTLSPVVWQRFVQEVFKRKKRAIN
jgi:O-antigen/teichoic acid export membrane protein